MIHHIRKMKVRNHTIILLDQRKHFIKYTYFEDKTFRDNGYRRHRRNILYQWMQCMTNLHSVSYLAGREANLEAFPAASQPRWGWMLIFTIIVQYGSRNFSKIIKNWKEWSQMIPVWRWHIIFKRNTVLHQKNRRNDKRIQQSWRFYKIRSIQKSVALFYTNNGLDLDLQHQLIHNRPRNT